MLSKVIATAAFLLCTAVAAPVMAQSSLKGLAAYQAGDYETALQELRPLAEQGAMLHRPSDGGHYND